jgi:hypothetical protein
MSRHFSARQPPILTMKKDDFFHQFLTISHACSYELCSLFQGPIPQATTNLQAVESGFYAHKYVGRFKDIRNSYPVSVLLYCLSDICIAPTFRYFIQPFCCSVLENTTKQVSYRYTTVYLLTL